MAISRNARLRAQDPGRDREPRRERPGQASAEEAVSLTMPKTRGTVAVVSVVIAAGCAVNKRPPTTVAAITSDARSLTADYRATMDSMVERLARRAVVR